MTFGESYSVYLTKENCGLTDQMIEDIQDMNNKSVSTGKFLANKSMQSTCVVCGTSDGYVQFVYKCENELSERTKAIKVIIKKANLFFMFCLRPRVLVLASNDCYAMPKWLCCTMICYITLCFFVHLYCVILLCFAAIYAVPFYPVNCIAMFFEAYLCSV